MKNIFNFLFLCSAIILTTSCKNTSGEKADVGQAAEVAAAEGMDYTVNTATSAINWEGSKPTGIHTGTIMISDGAISASEGQITGGSFTIDMNSITVTDLDGKMKDNLEAHLKGTNEDKADDFFNVNKYPTAKFEITKVTKLANDPEASHLVYGNLTIKETTKEVGFKAQVAINDGSITVSTPQFTIDRTLWGVNFRSPSFFENLKDKAISNDIGLKVELTAGRQNS